MTNINELLTQAVSLSASDLHLSVGFPPWMRIDGKLCVSDILPFQQDDIEALLKSLLTDIQQELLEQKLEIDFSGYLNDDLRYRANFYYQQRGLSAAFRLIPLILPTLENLGMPDTLKQLCLQDRGLLLITGSTGSGKSTTMAALINHLNHTQCRHIVTIEDPIEFIYTSNRCLIGQREVKAHTQSFDHALRAALRQDPDIIVVGELRDLETIRLALTAAETGHLVLSTLHTASAAKTLDRIVNVFPGNEREWVRNMLAESLQAIICQKLVSKIGGGRGAALEILINTPAIRNLIRENKIAQIYSALQTGRSVGMCTMEQSVQQLQRTGMVA